MADNYKMYGPISCTPDQCEAFAKAWRVTPSTNSYMLEYYANLQQLYVIIAGQDPDADRATFLGVANTVLRTGSITETIIAKGVKLTTGADRRSDAVAKKE